MFFLLSSHVSSLRFEEFDLYKMVPGNWSHFGEKNFSIIVFPVNETQKTTNTEPKNSLDTSHVEKFKGFYEDEEISISVLTNKSMIVSYLNETISLNFSLSIEGSAFADKILSDGRHLSVGGFTRTNFEITIADKEKHDFFVLGFLKTDKVVYTLKDFLIPTSIAVVIMIVGKKFLGSFA